MQKCHCTSAQALHRWWTLGVTITDEVSLHLIAEVTSVFADKPVESYVLCGRRDCKNRPAPFPGQMSYKATKPDLVSVLYLSMHYTVLLFIRAPFYVLLVFVAICSVFWLFWLSYQYLPSDWLKRLLWGSLTVARGSSLEIPGRRVRMIFFVYCIASLFYYVFVLSPAPTWYIIVLLWHDIAYLCWKCR